MIDHELGDGVNHYVNSFRDYSLFVVDIDKGKGLVHNSLVIGIFHMTKLMGMYDGCLETMFKVIDVVFIINVMMNGVGVDDVILRRWGLRHVGQVGEG